MELLDIPKPYKRFYDDKRRKRMVFVRITSWRGLSIGAKHFYAEVYEDSNPIEYKNKEYYFSEDKKVKGKSFGGIMDKETSFNTLDGAIAWTINKILKEFFNHKIIEVNGGIISPKEFKKKLKKEKIEKNIVK